MYKIEILLVNGTSEVVEGDEIKVKDECLEIWKKYYNAANRPDPEHVGCWPLINILRWKILKYP